jgi:adenylyl cyclase-associated protein
LVKQVLDFTKTFLQTAAKSKKPDPSAVQELLKPLSEVLGKIVELKDKNRASPLVNHLATVSEGIPAFGWLQVEPKPAPFVEEMKNAAQFYSNRILKEFKEKFVLNISYCLETKAKLNGQTRLLRS